MTLTGTKIQNRYDIGLPIGRGAMGEVYRATDPLLAREVAIKILPAHLDADPNFRERFLTEARLAAGLAHPNIVPIFDFGQSENLTFIAMALVEGQGLDKLIGPGELPFDFIEHTLRQLGAALDYAHQRGLVHRDIKPGNVVITPEQRVILMDFGIAKLLEGDAALTSPGIMVGTPRYSAPEIFDGSSVDHRADLYSFGVLAFEMVAGRVPFDGKTPLEMAQRHANNAVPDLSSSRSVPRPLKRAIENLLAKKPDERFDSAAAFLLAAFGGTAPAGDGQSRAGGMLSRLRSLFGYSRPPKPSHPAAAGQPRLAEADEECSQTMPPGTVVSPVAAPPAPPANSGHEEPFASDRTMLVSVAASTPDEQPSLPVALTLVSACNSSDVGSRYPLSRFPFVIGRGAQADLSLIGDSGISRAHIEIDFVDGAFRVRDCGSTNGVLHNGRHLSDDKVAALLFDDTLTLSTDTRLRFVADIQRLGDLRGEMLDSRYELIDEIYTSLKSATYRARDTRLPRSLVIKIFSPSLASLADYRDAYEREAEVSARLNHPHIRKVIDRGIATLNLDGVRARLPYLCMDEIEGGNLRSRIDDTSRVPGQQEVLAWVRSLASALDYAHAAGVMHGGLKPTAILFDQNDFPYLSDFSQSRCAGAASGCMVLGSPPFMAPEQWDGQPVDEASDQYAFACLIYLMLSGSIPYEGQSDPGIRQSNFRRGALSVHEQARHTGRDEEIAPAVSAVLAQAMSVEPADRFDSVLAFAQAFEQAVTTGRRPSDKPQVFLSYQRESSAGWAVLFARELGEKHGIKTFVDTERRDSAVLFPDKLQEAIGNCDVFVCLLAEETLSSSWVCEEIRLAFEHKRPMVPVFQENFRTRDSSAEPHIQSLLHYDGVHLLDRRNLHVDHTIADLAGIVQRTFTDTQ